MKILFAANTSWYLYNFRLSLARRLSQMGLDVVLVSPRDEFTNRLVEKGFIHLPLFIDRGGVNPIHDMRTMADFVRIIRIEKPDLVHFFTSKCVIYGSLTARLLRIKKIVNSITGMGFAFSSDTRLLRLLQKIIRKGYSCSLQNTSIIFQNSDDLVELQTKLHLDPSKVFLIPGSGVDINRFQPSRIGGEPVTVILAARMLRDKGVYEYVEAARNLKERGVVARFILVGVPDPGNPTSIKEIELKNWEKSNVIEWWGWKDNMEHVYSQADIVCLPSYREGLPKSLIEAAACGLPIVTTDTTGCKDVVINGVNGILVPPGDPQELADALEKLISNADLRKKMGLAGRILVEKKFDNEIIISKTLEVYNL